MNKQEPNYEAITAAQHHQISDAFEAAADAAGLTEQEAYWSIFLRANIQAMRALGIEKGAKDVKRMLKHTAKIAGECEEERLSSN